MCIRDRGGGVRGCARRGPMLGRPGGRCRRRAMGRSDGAVPRTDRWRPAAEASGRIGAGPTQGGSRIPPSFGKDQTRTRDSNELKQAQDGSNPSSNPRIVTLCHCQKRRRTLARLVSPTHQPRYRAMCRMLRMRSSPNVPCAPRTVIAFTLRHATMQLRAWWGVAAGNARFAVRPVSTELRSGDCCVR